MIALFIGYVGSENKINPSNSKGLVKTSRDFDDWDQVRPGEGPGLSGII
jgi:hypothetical protein